MFSAVKRKEVPKSLNLQKFLQETSNHVSLEGPKRLGFFSCYDNYNPNGTSIDNNSVFRQEPSALRYLLREHGPDYIDCLQGYDPNVKYGHFLSKDMHLRWVLKNEAKMKEFPSDFICNVGVLNDMMTVKYNDYDWSLSAIKVRGEIVLNKNESIEKRESIDSQSEDVNKSTYAAFNLPRLITKNINRSGIENDSSYGVFHSKIGSHRILHTQKLHCVESEQELDKDFDEMKFVSIKKINNPAKSPSIMKAYRWWSFAALTGTDKIVLAELSEDFKVVGTDNSGYKLVASLINEEYKQMAYVALNTILDFIKKCVEEEYKCYNFHFKGKDKRLIAKVKKVTAVNIIPSWYIEGKLPDKSQ